MMCGQSDNPNARAVEAIFDAALNLQTPERGAYLAEACGNDLRLRQRVEALLRAHQTAESFLPEQPAVHLEALLGAAAATAIGAEGEKSVPVTEKAGDWIGRYKLREKIGEGGCGIVYVAEQMEPVRRRVALKVIKLGMDTQSVIARFEAERQALALMDHPNIAKVLDAGATDTGRPYFVMELVRGVKITEYCDQNSLSTRERLDLFVQVCRAIQHAHQKGIIHRDIKPSNILVTVNDPDMSGVPKVIDFGIAKATSGPLTDKTVYTAFEQFLGTPAYMSPEQAVMTSLDIDTRSDIYSLGVLLYELLTGSTPFDAKELLASGLDEMRRTIRETEPLRPSTRLGALSAGELTTTAKHRGLEAPKLIHLLRGDLDWIVMKCLEKDRTRRYETANGLARDIHRHLNNEPVVARPPSAVYRVQKFVRRNKVMVASAATIATVLALAAFVSTWEAIRARQAERAQTRLRETAQKAEANEVKLRLQAEAQELVARQTAYASDVNMAQQALAAGNLGRAQELLDRHRPIRKPGNRNPKSEMDLRGWEWRYLWEQCRSEALYTLCQQTNSIFSLALSPDGEWLAVGEGKDEEGGLSIWDLKARRQIARLATGACGVRVAFSPSGSLLAFSAVSEVDRASRQFEVRVWDAVTRQIVAELPLGGRGRSRVQGALCTGLAFSPDGRTLLTATANPENQIALWRISDGKKLATYDAPQRGNLGTTFAVTPDLKVAAHETQNNMVRVIDLVSGKALWTAKAADNYVLAVALSPDGKTLATGTGFNAGVIRLWDAATGKELGHLEGHRGLVGALVFEPDGKTLASASGDQTICLWDVTNPMKVPLPRTLRGHRDEVLRLALLPDNHTLISGSKDGSVCVWDTGGDRPRQRAHATLGSSLLAWWFAPDNKSVYAVDRQGCVMHWQVPGFQESRRVLEIGSAVGAACLSLDCRQVAAGFTNGIVEIWDLRRGVRVRQFKVSKETAVPWQFLSEQHQLGIVTEPISLLQEWDLASGRATRSWQIPPNTQAFAYSPDERWCIALGYGGVSTLIDRATGTQTDPGLNLREASWAAFSPNGQFLAVASHLGSVRVWSRATLQEVASLHGFLGGCSAVAFSPDGQRLAVGRGGKDAVTVWDTRSYQRLLTLEGGESSFRLAGFSPDGNVLGSMEMYPGILNLWRAPSWAEIEAAERTQAR